MKTEIIKLLKAAPDYVSGQELCETFGVSRTAVWKVIRQLQEDGYEIEAKRNRGYRLGDSGDVFTGAELRSLLNTRWVGHNLVFLEQVDSTNEEAKRQAEKGAPDGTLVAAAEQSAGKGRRGRTWISEKGTGVWMSLLLRPDFPPECASMLTLVAAMAVEKGISRVTGVDGQIKWPNDVVIEGKKVCGILTEMSTEMECIHYVVVGIGINVGTEEFPEEIRDLATSLYLSTQKKVKRAVLAAAVAEAWEFYYEQFLKSGDLRFLMEEYNERLVNRGREVKVLALDGGYMGISQGINEKGELLVETGGMVRTVISGEVSVRGIYGYV
ncbi:MAG: biotin--[acetyl-CoA-carboxylase] ligase [Lachnospiraceae bacterium]|nr:biotin--[acetyl-CoA-carboxylase] ligase [Lachnospiraceae bacterium]